LFERSGPTFEGFLSEDTAYFRYADCENMDWIQPLEERVREGSCEPGNGLLGFVICGEFIDQLNSHQVLEDLVPLN
jgi:hypothetical protein